jgi:hypothetical protein
MFLIDIIDTSNEPNIINQILDNQKKQHKAQETLEEANWKVLGTKKDTFYDGAKWQQENFCNHDYILTSEQGHRVIKCRKCDDTKPI